MPYQRQRRLSGVSVNRAGNEVACIHAEGSIQASMVFDKGVTLYTAGTPNGWKANMIIEELGIPYKLHAMTLSENEQKQEWYLKINPNGRIPAIGEHTLANLLAR